MPTRTYYFPRSFDHLEAILRAEPEGFSEEDAAYFREKSIPPLPSEGALPLFLGISPKTIFSVRRKPQDHYRSFELTKKGGGKRKIDTPRTYLKVLQWWILDNILNHVNFRENVFGFIVGRNAVQNAEYHLGAHHLLNVDIRDFFPSISFEQVQSIFCMLGYSDAVATMLADLCCLNNCVPQGAPTSPAIANLVLLDLDDELTDLSEKNGCRYSRYADDLTFSSGSIIEQDFLEIVQKKVETAGFALKPEKTRFSGFGDRMEVTGIVINEKLQPTRKWRKLTRAKLHKLHLSQRLTRRHLSYLHGIVGMAKLFTYSNSMRQLSAHANQIIENKSQTVIGVGRQPILPNKLTLNQASALSLLAPSRSNLEIAIYLRCTESAVKKRLQEAFRKIGVSTRKQAFEWARENL